MLSFKIHHYNVTPHHFMLQFLCHLFGAFCRTCHLNNVIDIDRLQSLSVTLALLGMFIACATSPTHFKHQTLIKHINRIKQKLWRDRMNITIFL